MKKNDSKTIFLKLKNEYLGRGYAMFCGAVIVVLTFSIIFFLTTKGLNTFIKHGYSIFNFIFSGDWNPEGGGKSPSPQFGTLIFILGSTVVSPCCADKCANRCGTSRIHECNFTKNRNKSSSTCH